MLSHSKSNTPTREAHREMMTVEELMALLRVERGTIYGWVHRRQIPFHKLGPLIMGHGRERDRDARPLRFDYHEILEWTRTGTMPEWFLKANGDSDHVN